MDPFKKLPAELIHGIIHYTADFAGVESLLSASPQVKAVFLAEPRQIMKDLTTSNSIASIPGIQRLFRNIALIHCPAVHCTSLDEYIHLTHEEETPSVMGNADLSHQMLRIAAQIQRLACICLATMRKNLVDTVEASPAGLMSSSARAKARGAFSWIEEYRVYWTLWHLRHYSDLRKAMETRVDSPGGNWSWSAESIEKLDAYAVWNNIHSFLIEWIWTVATILVDLESSSCRRSDQQEQQESSLRAAWDSPPETPIPFFPSFELPRHIGNSNCPIWCPPPVPDQDPVTVAWFLTADRCSSPSGQTMLFRSLGSQRSSVTGHSVTGMIEIQPFRRLGVLLWDLWRMYSVGLYPNNRRETRPTPDGGFIEPTEMRETIQEHQARWLGLVGKELPRHTVS